MDFMTQHRMSLNMWAIPFVLNVKPIRSASGYHGNLDCLVQGISLPVVYTQVMQGFVFLLFF